MEMACFKNETCTSKSHRNVSLILGINSVTVQKRLNTLHHFLSMKDEQTN